MQGIERFLTKPMETNQNKQIPLAFSHMAIEQIYLNIDHLYNIIKAQNEQIEKLKGEIERLKETRDY